MYQFIGKRIDSEHPGSPLFILLFLQTELSFPGEDP
jgi:hypothetical protein